MNRLEALARATGALARLALWLAGTCLVAMTVLIFWQVVARKLLNSPSMVTEPLSILLMGWFIFLGAAVGTREGYHLSFDVLLFSLPDRVGQVLQNLSDLAVAGFGFGMFFYGGRLMLGTWSANTPGLGIPAGVALLPVVLGGVMVMLFSVERLLRRMAGMKTSRFGDHAEEIENGA